MDCSQIREHIKLFLDDRLDEENYQVICEHLENCGRCRESAKMIGSLSYKIMELGNLEVPKDLTPAILSRAKELETGGLTQTPGLKKMMRIAASVFVLTAVALYAGISFFRVSENRRQKSESVFPPARTAPEQDLSGKPKSPIVLEQYQEFSEFPAEDQKVIIRKEIRKSSPEAAAEQRDAQRAEPESRTVTTGGVEPSKETQAAARLKPMHWHVRYTEKDERDELMKQLSEFGIVPDYALPDLLVLSVSKPELEHFVDQTKSIIDPAALRFKIDFQKLDLPDRQRVSVYFERNDAGATDPLHWHLSFTQPNRSQLFGIIRSLDASIVYQNAQLIVLSISSAKLAEFARQIELIEGIKPNFGLLDLGGGKLSSYTIRLSLYITESAAEPPPSSSQGGLASAGTAEKKELKSLTS